MSARIEESVSDEVQTVLDEANCTPPVVENPDSLDFDVGGNANTVGPGVGNNDNPKELLDTIDMNHMRVLDIESAGFQTLKHGLDSPSFRIMPGGLPPGGRRKRGSEVPAFQSCP